MLAVNREQTKKIEHLFADTYDTCVFSCLELMMGEVHLPGYGMESAVCMLGEYAYLGGLPDERVLSDALQEGDCDIHHLVPLSGQWNELIEGMYYGKFTKKTRYAFSKQGTVFDEKQLSLWAKKLPETYRMEQIDKALYEKCLQEDWCRDFVGNYDTYASFEKQGLGYVILKGEEIIAGASSYSSYSGGIEVIIATKEPYRRQGLARICASKLIVSCLRQGRYPNWDAANKSSAGLAGQLGYHFAGEYLCYEI